MGYKTPKKAEGNRCGRFVDREDAQLGREETRYSSEKGGVHEAAFLALKQSKSKDIIFKIF